MTIATDFSIDENSTIIKSACLQPQENSGASGTNTDDVTFEDVLVDNFEKVILACFRARELMSGAPALISNPAITKSTVTAIQELDKGVLNIKKLRSKLIDSYRVISMRNPKNRMISGENRKTNQFSIQIEEEVAKLFQDMQFVEEGFLPGSEEQGAVENLENLENLENKDKTNPLEQGIVGNTYVNVDGTQDNREVLIENFEDIQENEEEDEN